MQRCMEYTCTNLQVHQIRRVLRKGQGHNDFKSQGNHMELLLQKLKLGKKTKK